jgi:hypothetical protein
MMATFDWIEGPQIWYAYEDYESGKIIDSDKSLAVLAGRVKHNPRVVYSMMKLYEKQK